MAVTLDTNAIDGSTYVVTAAFTDAAGAAVTPKTLAYTLSDGSGTAITTGTKTGGDLAASIDFVFSGTDLDYDDGPERVLTIEATYDSTEGTDLPLNAECHFRVDDLVNV